MELVCIVCPNGCVMNVEKAASDIVVIGNKCKKGIEFAIAEITCPMRTISSTVATVFPDYPVIPVRVSAEIPKDRIFDVMREINKVELDKRLDENEIVIENVCGLSVDIITTQSMK